MSKPTYIYKPKYNGSMRFAMILWPVWAGLALFYIYQTIVTRSANPEGLLAVIFAVMAIQLPFRVFREIRFEEQITVERYLLPDIVIAYENVTGFGVYSLTATTTRVSLFMMNHASLQEFDEIMHRLMSEKRINLKKRLAK